MKKLLLLSLIVIFGAKTFGQSLTVTNNSSCEATFQVFAHDGVHYLSCISLDAFLAPPNTGPMSLCGSTSVTYTDLTDLDCGIQTDCNSYAYSWTPTLCSSTPPNPASSGTWDMVVIFYGSNTIQLGPSLGCQPGTTTSGYITDDCTATPHLVTWTTSGGNVTVTIN
jgi:hypothetical protein